MKPEVIWSDQIPEREGSRNAINDLCFSPDGAHLVVAVGSRVLVYDSKEGDLLHSLRGHKDTVYTVDYSRDGTRFASGGADKTVIVWTRKAEGILKYTHTDSVQRVVYNPCETILASCTSVDFGLWSQEQKSVNKHKVHAKILSASWNNDGQYLALGFIDGKIIIKDKQGQEKVSMIRSAPIWTICWSPSPDDPELLAVGCWDQTLSFYQMTGEQHFKDRKLGFNPCCVSYSAGGEYMMIGGSDCQATLCTREGVKLGSVCQKPGWVWAVKGRPGFDGLALGCGDGSIDLYDLKFMAVHSLYQERFSYRENMTDVIVQHLVSEQKVRIKCRDYVAKIAMYRDRLAVKLPDKVHIYELTQQDDNFDLHYRIKDKIYLSTADMEKPCDHLKVVSMNIILVHQKRIQLLDFKGAKVREWRMSSAVTFVKVLGGPIGGEGLLIGMDNGAVQQIFIDNGFPIDLVKVGASVVSCDLSLHRESLAVVDSTTRVAVYNLKTHDVTFQTEGANSVAFSTDVEDMLCYSGGDKLYTKTGDFPPQQQKLSGTVVGYTASKVFLAKDSTVLLVDVSQSSSMYSYIDKGDFTGAYRAACMGVTITDWQALALSAMRAMRLDIARPALIRLRNSSSVRYMLFLDLLTDTESRLAVQRSDPATKKAMEQDILAEVLAYQGRYQEAAKVWARNGMVDKAVTMFTDLRMWEEAKMFAANSANVSPADLVRRQAQWAEETHDYHHAAELYIGAGDTMKAATLVAQHKQKGWQDILIEMARNCPKSDTELLKLCGEVFSAADEHEYAKEVYLKQENFSMLMALLIKKQLWAEAAKLSDEHAGQFDKNMFLPYAEWLASNDAYDEALDAYRKADRPDLCAKTLQELIFNAVTKRRFKDAAYYYYLSAKETLRTLESKGPIDKWSKDDHILHAETLTMRRQADLYYGYHFIHSFTTDPFTSMQPEMLFQVSRYLLNLLGQGEAPYGVRRVNTLYTLAKQAMALGAFKLARFAYDRLQQQCVPLPWLDQIELDMLAVQSKPVRDPSELLPVCYRCGATNPLLNPLTLTFSRGDTCASCGHPFVRSFLNFEVLPLVEFKPAEGIDDEKALDLIRMPPPSRGSKRGNRGGSTWREQKEEGGADVMALGSEGSGDEDDGGVTDDSDPFNTAINTALELQEGTSKFVHVICDAKALSKMQRSDVYYVPPAVPGARGLWYRNMMPDIPVALSKECGRFFNEEDFEFAYLHEKMCPYSRVPDVGDYGSC